MDTIRLPAVVSEGLTDRKMSRVVMIFVNALKKRRMKSVPDTASACPVTSWGHGLQGSLKNVKNKYFPRDICLYVYTALHN